MPSNNSKPKFAHLHVHSHYSLLDGLAKIDELIDRAKELGMDSLALTDHGVMYGAIEFYQKAKEKGIKPIIGCEFYLAPNGLKNKRPKIDDQRYHLVLLAKNQEGYQNLLKLVTVAHLKGFYYKPRIDKELLKKYSGGLIGLSACIEGEVPSLAISGKIEQAEKAAREYEAILGKGNFYLEIQHHPGLANQSLANRRLIEMSRRTGIPLVATHDTHYTRPEHNKIQDILLCIQTNRKVSDTNRISMMDDDFSMIDPQTLAEAFKDTPEALENTVKIASECNLEIELGQIKLPKYEVPDGYTADSYLRKLCEEGIKNRYGDNITSKHRERLDYELSVIEKTGFASYFLIVQDFVNWAKNRGIVVGPGRGSAAGSFVSYLTNITNIDPIKYNLLFERFLNPERISMPDVDLDFADTRRDEVLDYVREKYGHDHVAQIITFGTMAARGAVRDAGRALGYPYDYCDKTAKMIPMNSSISEAISNVPELSEFYQSDPAAKKLLDAASHLEGVARHASMHACGLVITPKPVDEYTPLQYVAGDTKNVVTQYSSSTKSSFVEKIGLLKMDFLGLKNLTIIQDAINIIKKTKGLEININEIPLDDKKTFQFLQDALTTGIFQLESSGMKRYLKLLKPTSFEDIIAMVALYRPGPMDWIPDFIARKHGRKKIEYIHPKLEPILKNTYGVAVYQEQVMQISQALAGYSLGEADILRKAVGKKIPELIKEQKIKFIDGCVRNKIDRDTAEKVFSFIEPFAGYGFNRSHAACYALIGYQTAYLKAHFPTEFMAALLTSDQQDIDRVAIEVDECRHMGIEVLPPNINESFATFTVISNKDENEKIRFGLEAIKNVGHNVANAIVEERKQNGRFENLTSFIERVQNKDLNKKSLESLIKSGAMDELGERGQLLANIENLLNHAKNFQKNQSSNQVSLFGSDSSVELPPIKLEEVPAADKQQKLAWEKELLGLYISEHPLAEYIDYFRDVATPISQVDATMAGNTVTIGGIIDKVKKIFLKNQKTMLFASLEDTAAKMEVIVFPKTLEQYSSFWEEGKIVLVTGKVSDRDDTLKIICDEAKIVSKEELEARKDAIANKEKNKKKNILQKLFISLNQGVSSQTLRRISEVLSQTEKGNCKVYLEIKRNGSAVPDKLETPFQIKYTPALKNSLEEILKDTAIKLI